MTWRAASPANVKMSSRPRMVLASIILLFFAAFVVQPGLDICGTEITAAPRPDSSEQGDQILAADDDESSDDVLLLNHVIVSDASPGGIATVLLVRDGLFIASLPSPYAILQSQHTVLRL